MLKEKEMSLLVDLKIAGIKTEIATEILHCLENENQAEQLSKFIIENKPITEKALILKVKEIIGKDISIN